MRGVWLSYIELTTLLQNKSYADAKANIDQAFSEMASFGLNTVFVQVRPFSDALYRSSLFPWSHILTKTQGKDPGYDPLAMMIESAHARGLKIHAWVNPYRVYSSNSFALSADNPASQWYDNADTCEHYVITSGKGMYYNPAIPEVRQLVIDGIVEIIENYDVDGIQFDDYFYPDSAGDGFDSRAYGESGTGQSLADWRRSNVDQLLADVYAAVHRTGGGIPFGISPAANTKNNYNIYYADIYKWGSQSGYVDYLLPQIYFGFEHPILPFEQSLREWQGIVTNSSVKFYIGLAPYKVGLKDSSSHEWENNSDILKRQVELLRRTDGIDGFVFYSYSSLFSSKAPNKAERENLKQVL